MIVVTVDFNSDEALYMQLCNQIILGIATSQIQEGDSLPSVRQMAHTVNKAYTILKQEGYIKLDRRHGAIIAVDSDKLEALERLEKQLRVVIAQAMCKCITKDEIHTMVDNIIDDYIK